MRNGNLKEKKRKEQNRTRNEKQEFKIKDKKRKEQNKK
jgi:hypothetical protein